MQNTNRLSASSLIGAYLRGLGLALLVAPVVIFLFVYFRVEIVLLVNALAWLLGVN